MFSWNKVFGTGVINSTILNENMTNSKSKGSEWEIILRKVVKKKKQASY